MSDRVTPPCAGALADHVPVAGAPPLATLRPTTLHLDDPAGQEGRREILNAARSDIARPMRRGDPQPGADATKTSTFGVNPAIPTERGTTEKIFQLSRRGAEPAREAADQGSGRRMPGSVAPGTKPDTLWSRSVYCIPRQWRRTGERVCRTEVVAHHPEVECSNV